MSRLIVAPALREGDRVGVVATGFAVDKRKVEAGVRRIETLGLRVRLGRRLFSRDGYLAGDDEARASDLREMLESDDIRAIHFARGGWGTSRFLPFVPWRLLAAQPKLLIGYSDLTSLFVPALERSGLACVYGPLVTELGERGAFDLASLTRAYFRPREPLRLKISPRQVLAPGRGTGRATGGCLTLIAHLAGTPFQPAIRGRVLLVEEIGEPPYRIDRNLTQMRLAGLLDGVRGVLIGSLTGCKPLPGAPRSPTALRVLRSAFGDLGVPVVAGLPFGHIRRKLSLPLGFRVRVDTARREIVFSP